VTGDVWLALLSHSAADLISSAPAGWTLVSTLGSGSDVLDVYAHMVGDNEPISIVFQLASNVSEWQGELVTLTGTSPSAMIESAATASFSSTTTLTTAGVTAQQAIDLVLAVWTCAGTPALTLPAGFAPVDSFNTGAVTSRSMLIGYQLAGATGALTFSAASASVSTTGRSFTYVLRDRVPVRPAALVDSVPGNIGLIAKDTRPPR
jgi:hypothetical protein